MLSNIMLGAALLALSPAAIMEARRRKNRAARESVFSNIGQGTHSDVNGGFSKLPDTAIPTRYLFAVPGSDSDHAAIASHTGIPCGVFQDTTLAVGGTDDLTMPVAIRTLGAASETRQIAINSTVALGDFLVPDDGGYAKTLPTASGTYYICGRALMAGQAGDTIEMDPSLPVQRVV